MTAPPLGVGERAPDFVLRGTSGGPERFYAHAGGRPTALVFSSGDDAAAAELVAAVAGREDVAVCRVTGDDTTTDAPVPTWWDPDGKVRDSFGVAPGETTAVVFDANLRTIGHASGAALVQQATQLLEVSRPTSAAAVVHEQAPVLLVPRVLDDAYRQRLIDLWTSSGAVETGVARATGEELDPAYKQRRDHTVSDPELLRELSSAVGRRVIPEIHKAFAFRATRFEGFKIACYDASTGGFFRAHRDNLSRSTAHRVFALTLNLNVGYEGGELRFPEYANALYKPAAGEALVFSCSHLHEVLDVTGGRRFVLLSFLYGDDVR
jgi:predicted 2-oxoglutarate/Fe(II)-dependent dioxygenase YbiX